VTPITNPHIVLSFVNGLLLPPVLPPLLLLLLLEPPLPPLLVAERNKSDNILPISFGGFGNSGFFACSGFVESKLVDVFVKFFRFVRENERIKLLIVNCCFFLDKK
jgi:hypothetical protein